MDKLLIILIALLSINNSFSQTEDFKAEFDSIIEEANLLYEYERVTWNSPDLAAKNENIKGRYGSYILYHDNDSIFSVYVDQEQRNSVTKYTFLKSNLNQPIKITPETNPLTELELNLIKIKGKVLQQLNSNAAEYELSFSEGYNPNLVMVPNEENFDFYIIIGTPKSGVIPFGNDYYFNVNRNGDIVEWKKLHKSLILAETEMKGGGIVMSFIHSHLKMTPHITATDICTFRLYGVDLNGFEEFQVLSTSLGKLFKYNASTNTISETEY